MNDRDIGVLIAKMNEKQLSSLHDAELERVFAGCVSPVACIRGVNRLLEDGRIEFDGVTVRVVKRETV